MGYVFIAHVEEDANIALGIALGLEEAGYRTWCYEVDSIVGTSYIVRTGEAVEKSDAVILIISPHSLSSNQVTKEVVRAHESGRPFLPLLHGISHVEFQQRQPEWREAIGSATSIRVPRGGVATLMPVIIEGIKALNIKPSAKIDTARIGLIREQLDELSGQSRPVEGDITVPSKPIKERHPFKLKKSLLIIISSVVVVAIAATLTVVLLTKGDGDSASSANLTSVTANTTTPISTSPADEYVQRGLDYLNDGKYEQAIALFDLAIELDPNNAEAYFKRGCANYYLTKNTTAIYDFTKAIELNPYNADAYAYRGQAYFYLNDYNTAIYDLTQAIELDPYNGYSYYYRGNSYYWTGENSKAVNDLLKAIELVPNYSWSYCTLAYAYSDRGEYDKAITNMNKAVELSPNDPDFYHFRGWLYLTTHEYSKAIDDFSKTLVLSPNREWTYVNRGLCYKALGNKDAAIADFNKCIELGTIPEAVQQAQAALIELQ